MDRAYQDLRFAADCMLGRLAKWLRVMGQDVIYGPHLTGYGLIYAARRENRIILTRDRRLRKRQPPDLLFIESDHFREQLRQVVRAFGLKARASPLTRCLECNTILESVAKASVQERVPPYVYSTQESFSGCRQCRRVYWPATHHERMLAELTEIEEH